MGAIGTFACSAKIGSKFHVCRHYRVVFRFRAKDRVARLHNVPSTHIADWSAPQCILMRLSGGVPEHAEAVIRYTAIGKPMTMEAKGSRLMPKGESRAMATVA